MPGTDRDLSAEIDHVIASTRLFVLAAPVSIATAESHARPLNRVSPAPPELHCKRPRRYRCPADTLAERSGPPVGRFRMTASTCPRCGHAEWRSAGMLREAPGRQAIAWRCVACNWPRLVARTDMGSVPCATCHETNRVPRFADWFTCWNCDGDSPVA